jgi:hypothetical protein
MYVVCGALVAAVVCIIVLWIILRSTQRERSSWEFKYSLLQGFCNHLERKQRLLLSNASLIVSEKLMDEEEWEEVVVSLTFSEYLICSVDRVPFETTVEKWVDRLSKEQQDVRVARPSWIWGNMIGYPKAVCVLYRVGDVSIFFTYLTQLIAELSLLDSEKSRLTEVTLSTSTEATDLLARTYLHNSIVSR